MSRSDCNESEKFGFGQKMIETDAAFAHDVVPVRDVTHQTWHRPTVRVVLARAAKHNHTTGPDAVDGLS